MKKKVILFFFTSLFFRAQACDQSLAWESFFSRSEVAQQFHDLKSGSKKEIFLPTAEVFIEPLRRKVYTAVEDIRLSFTGIENEFPNLIYDAGHLSWWWQENRFHTRVLQLLNADQESLLAMGSIENRSVTIQSHKAFDLLRALLESLKAKANSLLGVQLQNDPHFRFAPKYINESYRFHTDGTRLRAILPLVGSGTCFSEPDELMKVSAEEVGRTHTIPKPNSLVNCLTPGNLAIFSGDHWKYGGSWHSEPVYRGPRLILVIEFN